MAEWNANGNGATPVALGVRAISCTPCASIYPSPPLFLTHCEYGMTVLVVPPSVRERRRKQ